MSVESYLHAVPKAELHVHLEGAIQAATILALAKRNKIDISVEKQLRQDVSYRDFDHFVDIFLTGIR